jgi:hypothetical protein
MAIITHTLEVSYNAFVASRMSTYLKREHLKNQYISVDFTEVVMGNITKFKITLHGPEEQVKEWLQALTVGPNTFDFFVASLAQGNIMLVDPFSPLEPISKEEYEAWDNVQPKDEMNDGNSCEDC